MSDSIDGIVAVVITIFGFLLLFGIILDHGQKMLIEDRGEKECKELGYNCLNDYNIINESSIKIECDNIVVNKTYELKLVCLDYDKWKECNNSEMFLVAKNV